MNTMQFVSAVQYELKVCEGPFANVHGHSEVIKEIFIPSHQVITNTEGFVFHAEKPRNEPHVPLKNIQLALELVEKIAQVAKLKLEIKNKEKEVTSDLESIWKL